MSKSPNFLLPAASGAALVMGLSYGLANREYGASKIEALETRLVQVETSGSVTRQKASEEAARAQALAAEIEDLKAQPQSASLTMQAPQNAAQFGLGREALPEEIAAWDVDILPDGRGLPVGSGDVWMGEETFVDYCAACHGDFAEGVDNWPVLAGGFGTLGDKDPVKTVGSYWPYLSTVWDYVNRSMPFGNAGTLTADETYAIVAYILYSNDLVDDDFVLSNETFLDVEMPNAGGFVIDDRPELEYSQWRAEPCMEDCKDSVDITMRAIFLDVTPENGEASVMNHASVDETPSFGEASDGGIDPALIAAGEKVFRKCSSCHEVGTGASNGVGPHLNGILGRALGSNEGFRYSSAITAAAGQSKVWDAETLSAFLSDPRGYLPGTSMAFPGLRDEADITAITAYLQSVGAE